MPPRLKNNWQIFVPVLLLTFCFAGLLFDSGSFIAFRDMIVTFIPGKYLWLQSVLETGMVAYWNPYLLGGTPHFADLVQANFYPGNLVLLFFDPSQVTWGISWFIYLHFTAAFFAMMVFLQSIGIHAVVAAALGLGYASLGGGLSTLNMLPLLVIHAFMPVYFMVAHGWVAQAKIKTTRTVMLVLMLAFPVFAGMPEFAYFWAGYLLILIISRRNLTLLAGYGLLGVFALALAALPLGPGMEQLMQSARQLTGMGYADSSQYALHPLRLINLILREPFGAFAELGGYWGDDFVRGPAGTPLFYSLYVGVPVLVGLIAYPMAVRKTHRFYLIFGAVALLVAMGPYLPVDIFKIFYHVIPLFGIFRYPEKFFLFVYFGLFVAAALGWQALARITSMRRLLLHVLLPALIVVFCSILVHLLLVRQSGAVDAKVNVSSVQQLLLVFSLTAMLLTYWLHKKFTGSLLYAVLFSLVALEVALYLPAMLWPQPAELLQQPLARKINSHLMDRQEELAAGKAFRFSSETMLPENALIRRDLADKLDHIGLLAYSYIGRLRPNNSILFGIHDSLGIGVLTSNANLELWRDIYRKNQARVFEMMGVYYLGRLPDSSGALFDVQLNPNALDYIYLPTEVRRVPAVDIAEHLTDPQLNLRQTAFITDERVELSGKEPARRDDSVKILIRQRMGYAGNLRLALQADNQPGAVLVVGESYSHHFVASVNGKAVETVKVNGWSTGVILPGACRQGCEVQLEYRNRLIAAGAGISGLTILLLIVTFFYWRRMERRQCGSQE